MATFEEASRCPKCKVKGEEGRSNQLGPTQGKLVTMVCRNSRCSWFNTTWVVQVKPDGSVPDPDTGPRSKGAYIPTDEEVARINRNAENALDGSLKGGELKK